LNLVLEILTSILAFSGIAISIWSIIDTRKKYYDEFIENRKGRQND